jgi:hypothetical protein
LKGKGISWLAVAGIASVLLGCGSGSSTPGGASATSTVGSAADSAALAAYIEHGDQVCRAADAAILPIDERGAEIQRRHRGIRDEAARMAPVLRHGLRVYRRYFRRFERIQPPPQEAAQVRTIIAGLKKVGDDIERLAGALVQGELARVKVITSEREVDHARVSAEELELGLKVCGEPPAQPSVSG